MILQGFFHTTKGVIPSQLSGAFFIFCSENEGQTSSASRGDKKCIMTECL